MRPKTYAGLLGGLLFGGGLASPDEAEAAARENFKKLFAEAAEKALAGKHQPAFEAGTLPDGAYTLLKELYPNLKSNKVSIAAPHGLISRGWNSERMATLYEDMLNNYPLKAVRSKEGNGRSPAALWQQAQKISGYFPVKEVNGNILMLTGMPKNTSSIQKYLLENGWGLGGRTLPPAEASLSSLGLEVPSSRPLRIEAADPRLFESQRAAKAPLGTKKESAHFGNTLGDFFTNAQKNKKKTLGGLLGLGGGLSSADAFGAEALPGGFAGGPAFSWSNESALRNLGIGGRGLLEGAGRGLSLGLADPGRIVSDWLNLPTPQTELEKKLFGVNRAATEALTGSAGGYGMARKAVTSFWRGIGGGLADKPAVGSAFSGLMGYFDPYEEE